MLLRICVIILAFVTAVVAAGAAEHNALLPQPQEIHYGSGRLSLGGLNICFGSVPSPEDRFTARFLSKALSARADTAIPVVELSACPHGISLERTGGVDALPVPGEHPGPDSREAYSLKATGEGVELTARSSAGLYYAAQTLAQLVEGHGAEAELPEVEIRDWPALAYRGIMMDMSHGALPTEREVKRQLNFLARWKNNQYYFYNEASIELAGYPLLNPTGRFSQAAVRRIVAYGRERHIDVIPCLELYGHLHDLFRVEKYSGLSDVPHGTEFDPRNPQVMALLTDWAGQIAALFPSPFVHVGFDETFQIEVAARQGGAGAEPTRLFVQQLSNVAGLFRHYGKTVMAWGDIMVKYPGIVSQLPPGLIAIAWEYDPDYARHYQRWLGPLVQQHVPHMIATGVTCWNQLSPDFARSFANIDTFLEAGRKSGALGMMNTIWTDDAQNLVRQAWPGMAYGAAAAWQSQPIDHATFFSNYARLTYPPEVAPEVAQALKDLDASETDYQKVFGRETMLVLWSDPFAPGNLKRTTEHMADLRQARLEAEDAEARLVKALATAGDPVTLKSLLVASRLLDYAGQRFETAPELEAMWKQLGPTRPGGNAWWNLWASQVTYQDHSRLVDLMDAITELRPQYRRAWLAEYTPYRLASALGRWEAEYQYWRGLQERLARFSDSTHAGDPLPPLEKLAEGP